MALPLNETQAQQLVDMGKLDPAIFEQAKASNAFAPSPDTEASIVSDALAAPVRPEYVALKKHYEGLGVGGLGGSPQTRALESLNQMDELAATPGAKLSNMDSARLKELQGVTAPQPMSQDPSKLLASTASSYADLMRDTGGVPGHNPAAAAGVSAEQEAAASGRVDPSKLVQPAGSQSPQANSVDLTTNTVDAGLRKQEQGVKEAGEIAAKSAQEQYKAIDAVANEAKLRQIEQQKVYEREQAEIDTEMSKAKALSDEVQKAAAVDPNRVWNNLGTGNKIVAAIAIALGGIGAGMTGKENAAMAVIDKAIERDLEAQKLAITQKQSALGNQMNIVSMMRQHFGDVRQADAAALASMYENAKLKVQAIATKYQGPEMQAKAKQLMGELEAKHAATLLQFRQAAEQQAALRSLTSGGSSEVTGATLARMPKEIAEKFVQGPGFKGLTFTAEGAKKVRDATAVTENASAQIDRLLQILKQSGREVLPSSAKAEAKTLAAMLKGGLRTVIVGPGAVSESEWKLLNEIVANPTVIMQMEGNTSTALNTLKSALHKSLHATAKAEGAHVANVGFEKR